MFHRATDSDQTLLSEWRWLLGGLPRLVGWSVAGDLFLVNPDGKVSMLDPGAGDLSPVADSVDGFLELLDDANHATSLLQIPIIRAYEQEHGPTAADRCLSFVLLPVFGGAYTVQNRRAIPITEHAAVTGDIHRQIRDLPDGARIRLKPTP